MEINDEEYPSELGSSWKIVKFLKVSELEISKLSNGTIPRRNRAADELTGYSNKKEDREL